MGFRFTLNRQENNFINHKSTEAGMFSHQSESEVTLYGVVWLDSKYSYLMVMNDAFLKLTLALKKIQLGQCPQAKQVRQL